MFVLIVYALFLIGLAFSHYKKSSSDMDNFAVAGRNQSGFSLSVSIAASCIGGSATIGVVSLAFNKGFPSFWYLGSGAFGLLILSIFLAKRVRQTGLKTLPELTEIFLGSTARKAAAFIIIAAWTAILAAQFKACAGIVSSLTGQNFNLCLLFSGIIIIVYTCIGGQISVIKSDKWQFLFIFISLFCVLFYLAFKYPGIEKSIKLEFFNKDFSFDSWSYYMLIIGGSYVVCPMLFGRLLSAKNEKTAFYSAFTAVPILILTSVIIVFIGLYAKFIFPNIESTDLILTKNIIEILPPWLGTALLIALLSAVISSADSCLITASTILSNDILKNNSVNICRLVTFILGIAGLVLSSTGKGILPLLFAANDIYVSGIVSPVFIAMVFFKKFEVYVPGAVFSIALGGILGLGAALTGIKYLSMAGVFVSLFICLISLKKREHALAI